ncbi:hypothetical protein PNOK_0291600 [Pyrrhoderma noxium]|uniref:Uncharacterized protein n=1 Tax=Pyrrhoderma noxium TaxID=2282107 RepID=A0A286UL84_9AGAM|nr:hypothetical protein PNOK_0291600 [Pyrrhoderma noxium]
MTPKNPPPLQMPKFGEPAETKEKIGIPNFQSNREYESFFQKQVDDPKVGSKRYWTRLLNYCQQDIRSVDEIKKHIQDVKDQKHERYHEWETRKQKKEGEKSKEPVQASSSANPLAPKDPPKPKQKIPTFVTKKEAMTYFYDRLENEKSGAQKTRMRQYYNFACNPQNDVEKINQKIKSDRAENSKRGQERVQKKRDAENQAKEGQSASGAAASASHGKQPSK